MATELLAQGGNAVDDGSADGTFVEIVGEGGDLDAELGEDIALDDEETAA